MREWAECNNYTRWCYIHVNAIVPATLYSYYYINYNIMNTWYCTVYPFKLLYSFACAYAIVGHNIIMLLMIMTFTEMMTVFQGLQWSWLHSYASSLIRSTHVTTVAMLKCHGWPHWLRPQSIAILIAWTMKASPCERDHGTISTWMQTRMDS